MGNNWELLDFPTEVDSRGQLGYIQENDQVPFSIERIFYIYDVPNETIVRGEHAHKETEQVVIAIHGSFDITVTDTETAEKYVLDEPTTGLHIPTGTWTELDTFSRDAVGLVIASREYDSDDYIHDFEELSQYTG